MGPPAQLPAESARTRPGAYEPVLSSEVESEPRHSPCRWACVFAGFCLVVLLLVDHSGSLGRGPQRQVLGPFLRLDGEPTSKAQACMDTYALSNFSSKASMEDNGWIFGWTGADTFRPQRSSDGAALPRDAYWGFSEAIDGELALVLHGRGLVRLDFGNARTHPGSQVTAMLKGSETSAVPGERSRLFTVAFEDGDVLKVVESNGMIIINSIVFDCMEIRADTTTTVTTTLTLTSTLTETATSTPTTSSTSTSTTSTVVTASEMPTEPLASTWALAPTSAAAVPAEGHTAGQGSLPSDEALPADGSLLGYEERMAGAQPAREAGERRQDADVPDYRGLTKQLARDVASESRESSELEKATQRLAELRKMEMLKLKRARLEKQHAEEMTRRFLQ